MDKKTTDRLIAQYYNSPKMRAIIDNIEALITENMTAALLTLKTKMGIQADGYWLELLGKRFEFPRPMMSDPDSAVFFGLVTNGQITNGKGTFGEAPFVGDNESISGGKVESSDAMYATLLGLLISSMRTTGSQDNIAEIVDTMYEGSSIIDHQDMTMTVAVHLRFKERITSCDVSGTGTAYDATYPVVLTSEGDYELVNGKVRFHNAVSNDYLQFFNSEWLLTGDGGISWSNPSQADTPPETGWTLGSGGEPAPTVITNIEKSGNDLSILQDNKNLIPKPAGVSLELVPFNYFGFDGNEVSFDTGIFK